MGTNSSKKQDYSEIILKMNQAHTFAEKISVFHNLSYKQQIIFGKYEAKTFKEVNNTTTQTIEDIRKNGATNILNSHGFFNIMYSFRTLTENQQEAHIEFEWNSNRIISNTELHENP